MRKTVTQYIMKGPEAVEKRLSELDEKLTRYRSRLHNLILLRLRYVTKGTGGIFERGTKLVARTLMNTIREVDEERKALQSFLGDSLRVWETKKSGPAPLI